MIITIDIITHGARLVKRFFIFFAKKKENMRRGERVIYGGEFSFIRFRGSVTPPRHAVRNIACNIFQFMLPHHTKPPTASWSKSCCRILRALTKVIFMKGRFPLTRKSFNLPPHPSRVARRMRRILMDFAKAKSSLVFIMDGE